jgi:hypothetical protein
MLLIIGILPVIAGIVCYLLAPTRLVEEDTPDAIATPAPAQA